MVINDEVLASIALDEALPSLNLKGGNLSVDDSVLDKPYSHYMALFGQVSHRAVKDINLYYTDIQGKHQPLNFWVFDKTNTHTGH